jgi:hypothetical protein
LFQLAIRGLPSNKGRGEAENGVAKQEQEGS